MSLPPRFTLNPKLGGAISSICRAVIDDQIPLDKAYAQHFRTGEYSDEEMAGITYITGGLIRRLNLYAHLLKVQIFELTTRFSSVLWAWCCIHQVPVPHFLQLAPTEVDRILQQWDQAQSHPALLDGCPEWLEQCGCQQLGERWPMERAALACAAKRFIRVNQLKISRSELQIALKNEGIETRPLPGVDSALEVLSNGSLFKSKAFGNGLFEQQDAGAQLIVQALEVAPGMRVIDACAGAGGKTLGLAAAMNGKGRLLALDVDETKLETLKTRAKRALADNIETRLITSSKTIKRQKDSADRLLLDVPCSGIGVFKRNPEAKWHNDGSKRLPDLTRLQQDILNRYSIMLKPGGVMIYSTCSILPVENQDQVKIFLARYPNFQLMEESTISPAATGFDGFYWAKMKRLD